MQQAELCVHQSSFMSLKKICSSLLSNNTHVPTDTDLFVQTKK